jgi:hypothetical protein
VAASRLTPQPAATAAYRELMKAHEACETHALGRGPDPSALLSRLASSFANAT